MQFPWKLNFFVSVLLFVLAIDSCRKADPYEKPLTPVKVKTAEQQTIYVGGARYSANIQPHQQVELAFKTSGHIQELLQVSGHAVEAGAIIAKGTLLARLRAPESEAQSNQVNAKIAEAQAAQTQVKTQFNAAQTAQEQLTHELERAARLIEAEALTKPEYEAVKTRADAGQAQVASLRAQMTMAQTRIDAAQAQLAALRASRIELELRAPLSGVLLKRNVEVGSFIAPGTPVFTIADTTFIKAVFGVPDVAAASLKPGTRLAVTSEAFQDVEFRGQLTRIAPAADPKTKIFDVEVSIPNPRQQLKIGMVVALQIVGKPAPEQVTVVPLSALLQLPEKDGGYGVFSVEKQLARLRRVKIGNTLGNMIAISEGVQSGEQVIVSGATLLKDGEQVRIIE